MENGSGGSGSAFGSCENGSDGSGFRFRFGSWATLQFLTRNYPRPNCLLKCLPNCLSPTREGFLSSFKINPAVRVIARQVRDKNCLAAIFAPRHQSVSSGPLGTDLVTRIAATSKSQIASDCNRNSKKSLRLRKHPLKPTLWTRESPVFVWFS